MANKKAEILTMEGQVVSPITLATNVLLEDGRTAQDLLDSRDESMFSPTITTSSSISKVGQGDNVDFSENIIDGAYKSCVLKGKTLVNYNAEGNDRDEYVCMPSLEGNNLTVNGTVEGKVKSAILKGQTLVNLAESKMVDLENNRLQTIKLKTSLKANTDYTLVSNISNNDNTGITLYGVNETGSLLLVTVKNNGLIKTLLPKEKITSDCKSLRLQLSASEYESGRRGKFDNIVLLEGDYTNVDIPYFEGMQSVKMPVLTTTGKNLFDGEIELDKYLKEDGTLGVSTNWATTKNYISVRPNTTYTQNIRMNSSIVYVIFYDKNKNIVGAEIGSDVNNFATYTTPNNCYYIKTCYNYSSVGNHLFQVEEGSTATEYEPYKSNILSTPEDLVLRKIGDVEDTLNCLTSELTQRIGEIVLDGSENWLSSTVGSLGTFMRFYTIVQDAYLSEQGSDILCDRFTSMSHSNWNTDIEGIHSKQTTIHINISTSKLESNDVPGFKKWLSNNPVTVCYLLATESVKTVDLSDNHVYSYKGTTHYTCSSEEGSLLPTLAIEEGVKYEAIIKPSTKYSVVFNRTEVASGLTVDLGGATANIISTTLGKNIVQITTLPTLSHNYVIFKGLGNAIKDVQVIEGDVADDIEYFEGMIDVKNPIVINCNSPIIFGKGGRL